ncbi:MAG: cytochrome P450 [Gemmatimonadetes bacterium]|nr:cytochrome P450 [Gemmatimonadota bacterium]MYF16600.1 cytochrome P450 [Gemmatimonadota bacterium]
MLRFAEEILLLLHDEDRGDFAPGLAQHSLNIALAGAVLMDLALENRIDTDLEHLYLADSTPLEDDLLDPTLADIARDTDTRDTNYWLAQTTKRGDEIRDKALTRLVNRGILEAESEDIFLLSRLVSRSRRYPTIDGKTLEEVRLRIMRVLYTDEIPDPRDIVIICLADACGVFKNILSQSELSEVQERIELIRKMDLIGQSVTKAIREHEPPTPVPTPRKEIPQAPGLPLIGNTIGMKRDLGSLLVKQYRNLGPIFRIKAFNRRFVVLVGPEANTFVKRGGKYLRTLENWVDYNKAGGVGRSIISMDGPDHIRLRKELADVYTHRLIEGRVGDAVHVLQQDIAGWPQDKPLPGLYTWQRIVLDQIGVLALSMPVHDYLDDIMIYFQSKMKTYVMRQQPRLMLYRPRVRRAFKRVEELAQRILADHEPEKRRNKPPDAIDHLLELHRRDPQFLPETDLDMLGPLSAGLDTVANICAFMFYELLKRPDLREQVIAEADALFDQGMPTVNDLRKLDVIHRTAMEIIRLYPLAPVMSLRTVANSFEFEGYKVPAGETLLIGFTIPHRMPEYFPNPERFDIDRYTAERAEHRQHGVYVPFGLGAHRCPGNRLAEVLIALNMATVLREAELVLHPPDCELKTKRSYALLPNYKFRLMRRHR